MIINSPQPIYKGEWRDYKICNGKENTDINKSNIAHYVSTQLKAANARMKHKIIYVYDQHNQ